MGKLVALKLDGELQTQGFWVTLEMSREGDLVACGNTYCPQIEMSGKLPAAPELARSLHQWEQDYRNLEKPSRIKPGKITYNGSIEQRIQKCQASAQTLAQRLNDWLDCEEFRPIDKQLRVILNPEEVIRVLIRTGDRLLQKLPWHLWEIFQNYPKAEVGLGPLEFERIDCQQPREFKPNVKILAILGNSQGIDVERDRQLLLNLPDAETVFLVEPQRQELNAWLWEKSWDIIFFAGHSQTDGDAGKLYINQTESLTITELWYALRKAVERGLQLAIFNSCDGLGLARQLDDLHIPLTIVMRELVPDLVAQEFLKQFLTAFAEGESFYLAVRQAREQLQGLEGNFPCATWLPAICQNPSVVPLTWEELLNKAESVSQKSKIINIRSWMGARQKLAMVILLGLGLVGWKLAAPKLARTINNLGYVSYLENRLYDAWRNWQLAGKINPDNPVVFYNQGWICEDVQDFDCAKENYKLAAERGLAAAYSNLSRLYILKDKDYGAAVSLLWQGLKQVRQDPAETQDRVKYALYKNLGWARLEQGRYMDALEHLEEAIFLDRDRASAYCLLAQVKDAQEEVAEAIAHWETCLDLASQKSPDEDVWIGMGRQRLQELEQQL